jgi:hypothetical protein
VDLDPNRDTVGSASCPGSGSVSISTICKDKLCFSGFPEYFKMLSKILKIMAPVTLIRKIKNVIWLAVNKSKKNYNDFPTCG